MTPYVIGVLVLIILTALVAHGRGSQTGFEAGVRHQRALTNRALDKLRRQETVRARNAQDAIDYLYQQARAQIDGQR